MHDLLVIDRHVSANLGTDLVDAARSAGFRCEATSWTRFPPDRLDRPGARGVLAALPPDECNPAIALFESIRAHACRVPFIAVLPSGAPNDLVERAADAADELVWTPLRAQELRYRLSRALGRDSPVDTAEVRRRLTAELGLAQLVGEDPGFARVLERIPVFARTDRTVLVTGETGTGKELCARAIHHLGPRRDFPFVPVDCGAIPDHLFENELFGHVRGAFTDARGDQKGLVAMAVGGTVFLDEIDSLSPAAQSKLLRFIQERSYRPIGADRFHQANVNVIAATNRDLEACVKAGTFRADLYYRLTVLCLHVLPLRERRGDVPILARHFLEAYSTRDGAPRFFSHAALHKLMAYSWPGNVRELMHVVERAVALLRGPEVVASDLTFSGDHAPQSGEPHYIDPQGGGLREARSRAVAAVERSYVETLLRKHGGNITRAAREARQDRRAFGRLAKRYHLTPWHP